MKRHGDDGVQKHIVRSVVGLFPGKVNARQTDRLSDKHFDTAINKVESRHSAKSVMDVELK